MGNGKWEIRNSGKTAFFFAFLIAFSVLSSQFSVLHAKDPKDELKEIQKKLSSEKQKVQEIIKKEGSILSELEKINRALALKREELAHYDKQLAQTRTKIRQLEGDITILSSKLESRKQFLKQRLRSLYKQQHGEIAVILFSAKDYQDLIKKSRNINFIAYYDRKLMDIYSSEIKELNEKMQQMEVLKKELEINKNQVKKKADEMQAERGKKDSLLASVKKERSSYEKMIRELEESSKRLLDLIKRLEEKELPPSITGKGFAALKGWLPWPIDGKILVPFGSYKNPEFNIPVFKNGIEIKAGTREAARAVAGGKVVYADWFKGYGQLLIINHGGGYHTLYAHLSEIFHKVGDTVKAQQTVGKVGESGLLNTPSLYFEIRYKGKPLNPAQWLKKK
ncbi:MAG: peptidoglycan DD-metalloendopeptidase family protein [Nitrospirae bacterium]|nr:peptidoglycan DD-metalloendopeptidase family protein [Nitrospirota bacterium]